MNITLIAAQSINGVIGNGAKIPWHIPQDLKHFKAFTTGKCLLVGRKTFETLPLPWVDRKLYVLTRQSAYHSIHAHKIIHHVDELCDLIGPEEELCVIGGAKVYAQMISKANRLFITEVEKNVSGDACFPKIDPERFVEVSRHRMSQNTGEKLFFSLVEYKCIKFT